MILQTDRRLNEYINKYGCYFMSIMFILNQRTGLQLSSEKIVDNYMLCVSKGFMSINCYIKNPDAIFDLFGFKCRYNNRHNSPFYICNRDEIEILCIKYDGYKHFVVGDGRGNIAYNPMGLTAEDGYIESKRIFKI